MTKGKLFRGMMTTVLLGLVLILTGCGGGSDGSPGAAGAPGAPGASGASGATGSAANAVVSDIHGTAVLAAQELATASKYMVTVTITSATADASGVAKVNFKVMNGTTPVTTISSVSAGIFKLAPSGGGISFSKWVPYIWRTETVSGTADAAGNPFLKPDLYKVNQGYRESSGTGATNGTLVNNYDGTYTYTFKQNLAASTLPVGGTAITYERNRTHRVSVYMGGHSGPTGEADFDFVPDGSAVALTRNIVSTATCQKCHGPEFAGHGGDRVTVEGCVTCHSPGSYDAQSGESIEMAVMIHKIHAGNELATVAGPDKQYYDNPNTPADETADNGSYALWGNSVRRVSWENSAFPAVLANCQACHTGSGLQNVDNWKAVPSRAACGSCHDNINWTTGVNHAGGGAANDDFCAACHPPAAAGFGQSVTGAHNWTAKDIRNIPEFDITLTTSAPANGQFYVNGEKPVVSIALKDKATGAVIAPSSVIQDGNGSEGCIPNAAGTACTLPSDGLFTAANVYVTGPRAERVPVLTYAARAKVWSSSAGPWDLSAGGGAIRVKVDSGTSMITYDNKIEFFGYGADIKIPGDITVTLPAAGAALNALFANPAAATAAEVANWLNADPNFKERAFAYVDEALAGNANAGKLGIRSLGIQEKNKAGAVIKTTAQRNIQLVSAPAGMFAAADIGVWKVAGGADSARKMNTANATNPKSDFTDATAIKHTLDPVDNLVAGTYVINVEFADRGRGPTNPPEPPYTDYRAPSVAVATFQVKQAATEKPIADGCTACHWSSAGVGYVLDAPRHNKVFNEQVVDQCGGCHMYKSGQNPATTTAIDDWGTKPISRRTHAVHYGSALNYPTLTVGHEETAAFGRNWRITYPMNIRNCESCHPTATTSGTWKTNPNRVACMGCHDSDAATAHMKTQTYDPTPLAPWSGDEKESCKACHYGAR